MTFSGAVTLDSAGTINVSSGGGAGQDISFTSTIEDADNADTLNLNSGAAGNVTVGGDIGGTNQPQAFSVVGSNNTTLAGVRAQNDIAVTSTAGTALNSAAYTSVDGSITFTGGVDLQAGGTTTVTSGGGINDNITFNDTIDSTGSTTALDLNASTQGNVALNGNVGDGCVDGVDRDQRGCRGLSRCERYGCDQRYVTK